MFSITQQQPQQQPHQQQINTQSGSMFNFVLNGAYRPKMLYIDIIGNAKCGSCGRK